MIVDVSDRDQVAAAIDRVVDGHGSLDFIFNNAGVAIFGEVEVVTLDDWDKIIDVNLKGVAYGVKLAYDQMYVQESGHIINTASVAGLVPVPLQTHYVATKHAVVGMGKNLELEAERHGIFCHHLLPRLRRERDDRQQHRARHDGRAGCSRDDPDQAAPDPQGRAHIA